MFVQTTWKQEETVNCQLPRTCKKITEPTFTFPMFQFSNNYNSWDVFVHFFVCALISLESHTCKCHDLVQSGKSGQKWLEQSSKCCVQKTPDAWTFIIEIVLPSLSPFLLLPQLIAFSYGLFKSIRFCPFQFNYQQALSEVPQNELVIISFQGV